MNTFVLPDILPDYRAAALCFYCSEQGTYLSGAILDVNAGWTAKNMA